MKSKKSLLKVLIIFIAGAVLTHFGLNVSSDQLEKVVDDIIPETILEQESRQEGLYYEVLSVIDGDTFIVSTDGVKETVRVLGINTPETKHSSRGAECFGEESSARASQLLLNSEVRLEQDDSQAPRDKYNRLLAYVEMPNGIDFGQVMIVDGYAYEFTFNDKEYQNQSLYRQSQAIADSENVGLWGACQ